ncbi:MAG: alpha/beta hydrolase, partial [Bacillus sp. (in: firmicutes)]
YKIDEVKKSGYEFPLQDEKIYGLIQRLDKLDLSNTPEKLNNRPLMFWHSKQDQVVPYEFSYQFYEKIKPLYNKVPDNLQFISDEKSGHKVSRVAMLKTIEWFENHL